MNETEEEKNARMSEYGFTIRDKDGNVVLDMKPVGSVNIDNLTFDDVIDLDDILEHAEPMTYGIDDGERILDTNVRHCLENTKYKPEEYFLDYVTPLLERFKTDLGKPIDVRFGSVLVYPEGGHFDRHLDTQRYRMVGTLILTSKEHSYEGGELIVYNDLDYTSECDLFKHTIIPIDAEHEVKEVTKGHRVILKYHIFLKPGYRRNRTGLRDRGKKRS